MCLSKCLMLRKWYWPYKCTSAEMHLSKRNMDKDPTKNLTKSFMKHTSLLLLSYIYKLDPSKFLTTFILFVYVTKKNFTFYGLPIEFIWILYLRYNWCIFAWKKSHFPDEIHFIFRTSVRIGWILVPLSISIWACLLQNKIIRFGVVSMNRWNKFDQAKIEWYKKIIH